MNLSWYSRGLLIICLGATLGYGSTAHAQNCIDEAAVTQPPEDLPPHYRQLFAVGCQWHVTAIRSLVDDDDYERESNPGHCTVLEVSEVQPGLWVSSVECDVVFEGFWVANEAGLWHGPARWDDPDLLHDVEAVLNLISDPPLIDASPTAREETIEDDDTTVSRGVVRFSVDDNIGGEPCSLCDTDTWYAYQIRSAVSMSRSSHLCCFSDEHGFVVQALRNEQPFYGEWLLRYAEQDPDGPSEPSVHSHDTTIDHLMGRQPQPPTEVEE